MSTAALDRAQEKIQRLEARASGLKDRADEAARRIRRDMVSVGGAYAYGAWTKTYRQRHEAVPTVLGLDPELAVVAALYLAGEFLDGEAAEMAHDVAIGVACGSAMQKAQS